MTVANTLPCLAHHKRMGLTRPTIPFHALPSASDGLSSTRQTVLQLLLRRMSDPGQLVELMASGSSPSTSLNGLPAAHDAAVNPFVIPSETWPSSRNRASFDSGTDPTPVASSGLSGARLGALKPPANTMDSPEGGNIALTSLPSTLAGPDLPPPSPMELQSLLLNVATAETIMKIDAWGNQASSGVGGGGRGGELEGIGGEVKRGGNLSGGVGEAAVEMLGRLTNQLVSRLGLRVAHLPSQKVFAVFVISWQYVLDAALDILC